MSGRVHSLDGLRALSIALVMTGHFTKTNLFLGGFGAMIKIGKRKMDCRRTVKMGF